MFRSFRFRNYRVWFLGALVSNIGTWMQRTAQSWLVFDELTDHDSTAMGVVMALQFLPQLFLAPWAGVLADRLDRRRLLLWTQTAMAALAAGLGLVVLAGVATLWLVYGFALALGVAATLDAPVRQTFVSEMVDDAYLSNAVALNSTSFNAARMIGPAVAGVLVASIGSGWVFLLNTLTFGAMLAAILIGTFGLNFAVFLAAMAGSEFGQGSEVFGLLNSVLAVGTVAGALLSARRRSARLRYVYGGSAVFGLSCLGAATAPTLPAFALWLVPCGLSSLTIMTTANAYVQSTTSPVMRGRVMSLYMAIFMGGTPIGAPVVGWITDALGARWGMGAAVAAGLGGAVVGLVFWLRLRAERSAAGPPG